MSKNVKHPLQIFKFCPKCGSNKLRYKHGRAFECLACGFEYFFNASGAVIAVIFNEQGDLLVTRRAFEPAKGTFDLPGGFIDPEETAEETLVREVKEELNLDVVTWRYLFTNHNQYPYSGIIVFTVDLVFECQVNDFSGIASADDVAGFEFVSRKDLEEGMFGLKSCNEVLKKMQLV